jgi:hypothetical protein
MFCNRSGEECFFFDIDVKGGEKISGEEIRMHVGACIAINAKGGDCWKIFNRQRMLVIDGKYRSNDGLSTTTMINRQIEDKSRKIE